MVLRGSRELILINKREAENETHKDLKTGQLFQRGTLKSKNLKCNLKS